MPQDNGTFIIRDRRPGFLRVYNDLYDTYGAQLGPYGLAVYVALCRYANQDSEAWPSYSTIARGTGISRRQVIREIQKLEGLHIIAIEHNVEGNKNTSNTFVLLDTSNTQTLGGGDTQSLGGGDTQSLGGDTQSPKQNLNNKGVHHRRNKKKYAPPATEEERRRAYIPEEYADIIIGASHSLHEAT